MKTICAWCGKHISGDKDDPDISHGICKDCEKKERGELERMKKRKGKKQVYIRVITISLLRLHFLLDKLKHIYILTVEIIKGGSNYE